MNRNDLHQFHLYRFGRPNCGVLPPPTGYSTNWWMFLWVLNFSIWKTLPRTAQCRRCRKGKGMRLPATSRLPPSRSRCLGSLRCSADHGTTRVAVEMSAWTERAGASLWYSRDGGAVVTGVAA